MAIECPRCTAQNPENNRFCGNCGEPLTSSAAKVASEPWLREQVSEIIEQHYKDQKIVEIETTEAIAARLLGWAKLLAFFIGAPVTVLLLILTVLGISKYSDFSATMNKLYSDAMTKASALANAYDQLSNRYENTKAIADRIDALAKKVDIIGESLGFTPSSNVSTATMSLLEVAFSQFQEYLRSLGYKSTSARISIHIGDIIQSARMIAYYDPSSQTLLIDSKYAADPAILYHEYMHYVLNPRSLAKEEMPWAYYDIESGLSWYFTCSYLKNPKPAQEAVSWNLLSKRKFTELKPTIEDAMINGTEIWGSAFWEIREVLGQDKADKLLFETWFELKPDEVKTDKGAAFVRKLLSSNKTDGAQIRAIFSSRGLIS